MSKNRKKNINYNTVAVDGLVKKFGFSRDYVLKSIRGDRTGVIPTRIQDEYNQLERTSNVAIQNKLNEL